MGYRTILVGTDGSKSAIVAEQAAARLAKRLKARLLIVTAYEPAATSSKAAEALLAQTKERAAGERVEADTLFQRGAPEDVILEVAEREGADLVVVGNIGIGQATRFRLGSVPDRVAHFASSDLLIVDTTSAIKSETPEAKRYSRFLIGTDGSPTASEAARKGLELAMRIGADVTLLYVGDPLIGAIALENTEGTAPDGVEVERLVLAGDPSEALVKVSEEKNIDLIVVGNKGMSGARRFLLGSVPNKVAHYAPTDVLVAKTVGRKLEEIAPGHGAVIDVDGRKLGVFRDEDGTVVAVNPRCTHMGCVVDWNDADRTWDCPCHGSRYDTAGQVIRGPAANPLAPEEIKP